MKRLFFAYLLLIGCSEIFEFSPNQIFDHNSAVDLNAKNLDALFAAPVDDTVTIVFIGDSQRFYDEIEKFIDKVNNIPSVDFVLLAGDISDFGMLEEFEWAHSILKKLNKPYIGVVGNHDVLAKGEEVFERMYGPLNFSFIYDSVKFVVHNTNGIEYQTNNIPDIPWLESEFKADDGAKFHVAVSHVPPFDPFFNKDLEQPYVELLHDQPSLLVSLHGHIHEHKDGHFYGNGVRYITSHSFDKRSFVLLKIVSGKIMTSIVDY